MQQAPASILRLKSWSLEVNGEGKRRRLILTHAGNAARDNRSTQILPLHIWLAIWNDEELKKLVYRAPKNARKAQGILNAITKKPNWQAKLQSPVIVGKWMDEATGQGASLFDFGYAISQAEKLVAPDGGSDAQAARNALATRKGGHVEGVVVEAGVVPQELASRVQQQLDTIASGPEKDWHPDTNEMVLDLIHPSMYCYVKGKSPLTAEGEAFLQNQPLQPRKKKAGYQFFGRAYEESIYQWMPAEFDVNENGSNPHLTHDTGGCCGRRGVTSLLHQQSGRDQVPQPQPRHHKSRQACVFAKSAAAARRVPAHGSSFGARSSPSLDASHAV